MFIKDDDIRSLSSSISIGRIRWLDEKCSLSLLFFFFGVNFSSPEQTDTFTTRLNCVTVMLSYLTPSMQPQLSSSDSALGMCSSSSDEGNKSCYPNEVDSDGLFNSPHIPYAQAANHHKTPMPFVYGHTPTSGYGFGFNFYNEMSPFTGKYSHRE